MRGFSCYHYHNRKWKCALIRFRIEVFWKKYFLGEVLFFFLHSLSLSTIVAFFSHKLIWASKVKETNWEKESEAYCAGILSTGHTKGIYTVKYFFPRRALSFSLLLWPSLGKHFPLNYQLWARSWAQGLYSQLTSEHLAVQRPH